MRSVWSSLILMSSFLLSTEPLYSQVPPKAPQKNKVLINHGEKRVDNFYWLREKENPEVLDYLRRENQYTKEVMAPHQKLQESIFKEMMSRKGKKNKHPFFILQNYSLIVLPPKNLRRPL